MEAAGATYGWQVSLDQEKTRQTWTWHAYGTRGSRNGRALSESDAVARAKAAAADLVRPVVRAV